MTQFTEATKVKKVDDAFGTLIKGYVVEGNMNVAEKVLKVFKELAPDSKVKLFEILTKLD